MLPLPACGCCCTGHTRAAWSMLRKRCIAACCSAAVCGKCCREVCPCCAAAAAACCCSCDGPGGACSMLPSGRLPSDCMLPAGNIMETIGSAEEALLDGSRCTGRSVTGAANGGAMPPLAPLLPFAPLPPPLPWDRGEGRSSWALRPGLPLLPPVAPLLAKMPWPPAKFPPLPNMPALALLPPLAPSALQPGMKAASRSSLEGPPKPPLIAWSSKWKRASCCGSVKMRPFAAPLLPPTPTGDGSRPAAVPGANLAASMLLMGVGIMPVTPMDLCI